jgi:hypothetical protein
MQIQNAMPFRKGAAFEGKVQAFLSPASLDLFCSPYYIDLF